MNPLAEHALATVRHTERYRSSRRHDAGVSGARERVGLLLAGSPHHLMARGERPGPVRVR